MKSLLFCGLIFIYFINVTAQDTLYTKSPTIGLNFYYNDFVTAQRIHATSISDVIKSKQWNQPHLMEGGFGLEYLQGLTNHIDVVGTINCSWVDYLLPTNSLYGSSNLLLDINAGTHIKLLSDKYVVSPFLIAKAGFGRYQGMSGFCLIHGAGLQFNLFHETMVLATIEYRREIGKNLSDQIYYSIGLAIPVTKWKMKPLKFPKRIPKSESVQVEIPPISRDLVILVRDEFTSQSLPYVNVVVSGPEGIKLNGSTDAGGKVIFYGVPAADYTISGILNNINTTVYKITRSQFETENDNIDISLSHNDPRFTLSGVVINKTRNIPEGGAKVNITNETEHSILTKESHSGDGIFRAQLEAGSDFSVIGKKANYISNIEKISTRGLNRSKTLYVRLELGIEEANVGQSIVLNNIYFEINKAEIKTEFSTDLDRLIQFMLDNQETRLEIQGHTDNTGSLDLNNRLSQDRAYSIVTYLTKYGIASNRLSAKGYGPSMPLATNTTAEGRAKNRRVEMKVVQ